METVLSSLSVSQHMYNSKIIIHNMYKMYNYFLIIYIYYETDIDASISVHNMMLKHSTTIEKVFIITR
jgi:hypothetical protein